MRMLTLLTLTLLKCNQFRYFYMKERTGQDVGIEILVESFTSITNTPRGMRGGLMIRESRAADSRHFSLFVRRDGDDRTLECLYRRNEGESYKMPPKDLGNEGQIWLKITKTGNLFKTYYKRIADASWTLFETKRIDNFPLESFFVGIAVAAENSQEKPKLTASSVTVRQSQSSLSRELGANDPLNVASEPYLWTFNDDSSIESTYTCPGKVIDVKTGGKLSAAAGALLGVGNHTHDTFSIYQKWTKTHQKLSILSGPYSLVNADNKALSVGDAECADGMKLQLSPDDSRSSAQHFYLGNGGTICSYKCPGLVITAPLNCQQDIVLSLKTATGDDNTKWNFDAFSGLISSVKCPELVVAGNILKPSSSPVRQKWRTVNTRLLSASEQGWNQNWEIIFAEQYDKVLPRVIETNVGMKCYNASAAYSASFDAFSLGLIIDDATDEDQCRNTREMLGFDRDYPFDLEVRDEYHDLMCQGVEFTAVDHLTSGLSEPPVFEEVEFEAPEYPDDPELTFETLSTHTFAWPEGGLYYKETKRGYDTIVDMGQSIVTLTFTAKYAEMAYQYAQDKADSACNAQPSLGCVAVIAGNGGCIWIPAKSACEVAKLSLTNLFFALWKIAELTVDTLEHAMYLVSQ